MQLSLLHFNDLHGRFDQLPRLFTLIQRVRTSAQQTSSHSLLLEAGDSSSREVWESTATQGRANFALLEAMGVQATVLGNAEIQLGDREALAKLVASAVGFPVLAANLLDLADPTRPAVPKLKASHLIELNGFIVGLVGVTAAYRDDYEALGYLAEDPLQTLPREIAALKAQGAKLIILLSHLGVRLPKEEPKTALLTDDKIAVAFPEISVIVGGHSHSVLREPLVIGETLIVQAGSHGRYLGQLDLMLDSDSGRIRDYTYTLHSAEHAAPDSTIASVVDLVREEVARLRKAG
jgi:2',3'-cyclic-nucleotide 2'-phosphodiesterase (5'-nucleotidase family)